MLRYQEQDSSQTLQDGLAEYYAANVGIVTRPGDLPPESRALFLSHDLCHVIFGLATTLDDEAIADMRTIFSCDVGLRRYAAHLTQDQHAKDLFKRLGYRKSLWITLRAGRRIVRGALEALRMKKRWPWTPPDSFRTRALCDLRHEFGIRVI